MSGSGSLLDLEQERSLAPQDLSFQDFGPGNTPAVSSAAGYQAGGIDSGAIGSSMLKPQQLQQVLPDDSGAIDRGGAASGFWTLKFYQPLFDVDTLQVLTRVKASMLPRPRGVFFDLISQTPDLYGPFWIATTLIFSMAITGNLASFFAFKPTIQNPNWTYNFNQLTLAGTVVYSYVTLLPLMLWLLLRYYEASKRLVDILCIYGYTLGVFVPISVLCVVPSDSLRWLLVFLGGAVSGIFLLSNFHAHLSDCFPYGEADAKRKMYILLGGMAGTHVLLLFLFKIYFFHYA
uniref:Protein YIPF n=1 Tax=Calcidiscus leptoporus TaxID=127549 RepID=A0A7S0P223_9EUKA|mmetsp:Transcript_51036/g.117368  ORF Transcript_51036/g.117368 Transcript_51036/m.117368 type:complete len:290 (+) Transcript_51036:9-878(+)